MNWKHFFKIKLKLVFPIGVCVLLLCSTLVAGFAIKKEQNENIEEKTTNQQGIYAGRIEIYGDPQVEYCQCMPTNIYYIDVGNEGAELTFYVDFVIDARMWMDDGYVEISFVDDPGIMDSATSGEVLTGRLEITKFFGPGEEFIIKLFAKYTWWFGVMHRKEDTGYSFGSTLPPYDPDPELAVTPENHDFGKVAVGDCSEPVIFSVTNIGGSTAAGVVYTAGSQDFFIISENYIFELEHGEEFLVEVVFCPASENLKSGILKVDGYNCYDVSANLLGTGMGPKIFIDPDTKNFGNVNMGEYSDIETFTLTNNGGGVAIGVIYVEGSTDFIIVSEPVFALPSGESTMIQVVFYPTSQGNKAGTLFAYPSGSDPVTAILTGKGEKRVRSRDSTNLLISDLMNKILPFC